ncbi:MAG: hypothetical protein LBK57_08990 [Clostridiales Family XIII bacterium]|nr:hypothetical protein [Clostridiales Family XIII bacterium]
MNENLALCGWEDHPFAVQDLQSGQAFFVSEAAFRTLLLCNGVVDTDSFLIPERFRKIVRFFVERKIVEPRED